MAGDNGGENRGGIGDGGTHFAGDDVHRVELASERPVSAREVGDDGVVRREGNGIGGGTARTREGRYVLERDAAVPQLRQHIRLPVAQSGHV